MAETDIRILEKRAAARLRGEDVVARQAGDEAYWTTRNYRPVLPVTGDQGTELLDLWYIDDKPRAKKLLQDWQLKLSPYRG